MKDLTIFKFENNDVREITDKDGNPWFIAKDVCAALDVIGYRRATQKLDATEKSHVSISYTSSNGVEQLRKTTIINESGVFRLMYTSRKVVAERMLKWFANDVLPILRGKTQ